MSGHKKSNQNQISKAPAPELPLMFLNLAVVQRCGNAFVDALNRELKEGENQEHAKDFARKSYRMSMPAPLDFESTRDFIACVTFGALTEIFSLKEANALFYSAQIAMSACRGASEN